MLTLKVELDTGFMDILNSQKTQPSNSDWKAFCENKKIDGLKEYTLLDNEGKELSHERLQHYNKTVQFLKDNLNVSVDHISRIFPFISEDINHELTISLLPDGKANFGPRPSIQLFSLKPDADPYETYLFLIHIYYHEISFINYTEYCEECSQNPDTPDKLKYLILTLIQNEGIGNYAVLNDLIKFRDNNPEYSFQYFTYADHLNKQDKIVKSMSLLRQMFNDLNEDNFKEYKKKINLVLKNKQLPIINLVGTHMAEVIANNYGIDALKNVYNKRSTEFFKLYLSTDDHLQSYLTNDERFFMELIPN